VIDLDELPRLVRQPYAWPRQRRITELADQLVAEVRAARQVVEATRKSTGPGWLDNVHAARAAYDKAVG
jgi:hypothetical protein